MCEFTILKDANPNEFKIIDLDKGFGSTKSFDYCFNDKLPFKLVDIQETYGLYQKVNNSIYFGYMTKINADVETFAQDLTNNTMKIKNDKKGYESNR